MRFRARIEPFERHGGQFPHPGRARRARVEQFELEGEPEGVQFEPLIRILCEQGGPLGRVVNLQHAIDHRRTTQEREQAYGLLPRAVTPFPGSVVNPAEDEVVMTEMLTDVIEQPRVQLDQLGREIEPLRDRLVILTRQQPGLELQAAARG